MENIQLQNNPGIIRINLLLAAAVLFFFSLNSCGKTGENQSNQNMNISVNQLHDLYSSGADFRLIDVRTETEFLAAHLDFADDLIPYDKMDKYLDRLPENKEDSIYLFCRSGRRSGIATEYLRQIGYNNTFNVTGGIIAWQNAGYPVVNGPLRPDSSGSE